MLTPSDRSQTFLGTRFVLRSVLRIAAAALVAALGAAATAAAVPQSPDRPPVTAQEKNDLRREIESRYEALPVSGGVLLKARQARAGVRTIEVTGDQIAVNGERVTARTLHDWLGDDADAVLRLQAVPAAERRRILAMDAEIAGRPDAASPAAPAPPVAPKAPAAAETKTTSETDVDETSDTDLPAPAELPEPPRRGIARHGSNSRVNVGGSVHVRKNEVADEVVAVGGAADVEGDVRNDVAAIGGPVRIEGTVGGDVAAIGGSVYLGPHAIVAGGITSVGGTIEQEPGAVVHGATSQVGLLPFIRHRGFRYGPSWGLWNRVPDVIGNLISLVLTGLLVCLVLLVARRPLERVERQLVAQPWQAAAVGLASSIFFWPLLVVVTILLAITLIGCVLFLLYPFLLFYVALLLLLGYAAVSYRVGRWLEGRFSQSFGGPYATALLGVLALQGWILLGNVFDLLPGPFAFFAVLCWLFGVLATTAALVVGFGAVILSRLGLEPGYWPRRGAPPIPPAASALPVAPLPLTDPLAHPPAAPRWEEPRS
jgi:hypothetical protein